MRLVELPKQSLIYSCRKTTAAHPTGMLRELHAAGKRAASTKRIWDTSAAVMLDIPAPEAVRSYAAHCCNGAWVQR